MTHRSVHRCVLVHCARADLGCFLPPVQAAIKHLPHCNKGAGGAPYEPLQLHVGEPLEETVSSASPRMSSMLAPAAPGSKVDRDVERSLPPYKKSPKLNHPPPRVAFRIPSELQCHLVGAAPTPAPRHLASNAKVASTTADHVIGPSPSLVMGSEVSPTVQQALAVTDGIMYDPNSAEATRMASPLVRLVDSKSTMGSPGLGTLGTVAVPATCLPVAYAVKIPVQTAVPSQVMSSTDPSWPTAAEQMAQAQQMHQFQQMQLMHAQQALMQPHQAQMQTAMQAQPNSPYHQAPSSPYLTSLTGQLSHMGLLQQQKPQINHQDGVNPQYRRRGGAKFTAPQTF